MHRGDTFIVSRTSLRRTREGPLVCLVRVPSKRLENESECMGRRVGASSVSDLSTYYTPTSLVFFFTTSDKGHPVRPIPRSPDSGHYVHHVRVSKEVVEEVPGTETTIGGDVSADPHRRSQDLSPDIQGPSFFVFSIHGFMSSPSGLSFLSVLYTEWSTRTT